MLVIMEFDGGRWVISFWVGLQKGGGLLLRVFNFVKF